MAKLIFFQLNLWEFHLKNQLKSKSLNYIKILSKFETFKVDMQQKFLL